MNDPVETLAKPAFLCAVTALIISVLSHATTEGLCLALEQGYKFALTLRTCNAEGQRVRDEAKALEEKAESMLLCKALLEHGLLDGALGAVAGLLIGWTLSVQRAHSEQEELNI